MNDTDIEAQEPHAFVPCPGPHIFPRTDAHCAICDGPEEAEIHQIAEAA